MEKILLSFCIPTYNRPQSIENILNQITSFPSKEIEIIICDDNPIFLKTEEVVKKFSDPRIKFFKNKNNLGMDANMIKTILKASGTYIFILMDDDEVEIESIPWILEKIKDSQNLTQLCGSIGDKRQNKNKPYFQYKFGNILIKKGLNALTKLLFYQAHGSGIVLKKSALNLNKARDYIGCLYMQQMLIAQAILAGDTLCTTKIFAHIGRIEYKSGQPLIKGNLFDKPLGRLNRIKYRIKLINDVSGKDRKIQKVLLKPQIRSIYILLKQLKSESIKSLIEGLSLITQFKKISKSPRFWLNLIIYIYSKKDN